MRQFLTCVLLAVSLAGAALGETFIVLPFSNASRTPNLDWVGESIAETIREALVAQGFIALDREDRQEAYRRLNIRQYAVLTRASVLKIGETLDAGSIVYGQFELASGAGTSKGSLRMTARVLDMQKMRQSPAFGEVGALEELAALQRHLAWQTLKFAAPKSAITEQEFERRFPAVRVDAVENYIRGLLAENAEQKHRLFTQAARLDTRYSPPCYQLGRLNWDTKNYRVAAEWLAKVGPADPHHREATFFLGAARYYNGDFAGAIDAFAEVAKSVPLNEVLNNLGAAQSRRDLPEALANFRKALEGDPQDPVYRFNVGYALWKKGEFDAAVGEFRQVLDRDPSDSVALMMLGRCLKKTGPRPADNQGMERLKHEYQETAYLQLKEFVEPAKK